MPGQVCSSVCFIFQRNISKSNQHVLPPLISAVGCLARDDVIRHNFAHDPGCWKAFLFAIVSIIIRLVSLHTKIQVTFRCMQSTHTSVYSLNGTSRDNRYSWSLIL